MSIDVLDVLDAMYGIVWCTNGNKNIAVSRVLDRADMARAAVAAQIAHNTRIAA